jgi:hypothetical protein
MADTLIQEIRDNRRYATDEWQDTREEARKDKLCVAGKPWDALDPEALKARRETKRPFLALDELGQYINQTVNDVRANPRGIKFAPTGNGANDKGAEFYQNHTREIEYRSHARVGYSTAFEAAVTSGTGWIRIRTKREHIRTFNQDLFIEPVVNADQVLADPNAVWPDSRDLKYLYYLEPWTRADFKRKFPRAKVSDASTEWSKVAPQWVRTDIVNVGEYWRIETFNRRLVAFLRPGQEQPTIALVDELPGGKLPRGVENLREEDVEDSRVKSYLTNGIEILKEQKWAGKYIPFVSCYGKILYVDEGAGSRRQILSMTRLARDPYMLYCYIRTCEAEAIGGVPRATWVGYEGQFAKPDLWRKANREPVAFLEGKVTVPGNPGNTPLPLPHKEPWDPPLQNLELAAEAARRAIQAAMGITPLPTQMQKNDPKLSGKGMDALKSSGQRGSFHFVDHHDLMIERTGVIIEDLLDKTLDTARDVPVRDAHDSGSVVRINDPADPESIFTKGDYRVTISTGPETESQRQEASDFVDSLITNIGMIAEIAGPPKALMVLAKSIKLKLLGPIGDEIVDLLSPPGPKGKDGKPLPPEAQALLGQLQQLQQKLQQAEQAIQNKTVEKQADLQGKKEIEGMRLDFERWKVEHQDETKVAVAELGAKVERLTLFLQERARLGLALDKAADRAHEKVESAHDRVHELNKEIVSHAKESSLTAQAHLHAKDQADQSHGHTLEASEQAADLAPEPEAEA